MKRFGSGFCLFLAISLVLTVLGGRALPAQAMAMVAAAESPQPVIAQPPVQAAAAVKQAPTLVARVTTGDVAAATEIKNTPASLRISQVFAGGGAAGAPYNFDYVEIFNPNSFAVDLNGYSLQLGASDGDLTHITALSGSIKAGGYFLIQGAGGEYTDRPRLPDVDLVSDFVLALDGGQIALAGNLDFITGLDDEDLLDFVGYGNASLYEGAGAAPVLTAYAVLLRVNNGCFDTDRNNADFYRNSASPRNSKSASCNCDAKPEEKAPALITPQPTEPVVDEAPQVVSTEPAIEGTIAVDGNIVINFSEAVTVSGDWFLINCMEMGEFTATVSGSGTQYTLDPSEDFMPDDLCEVIIYAEGVHDDDLIDPPDNMLDNYFTIFMVESQGVEDAAPDVWAALPANGAVDVATNAAVEIEFDETVSLSEGWYGINCSLSGSHSGVVGVVGGTRLPSQALIGDRFIITPSLAFSNSETCTVTVYADHVADLDDIDPPDLMMTDYSFSFSTVAYDSAPAVLLTLPINGQPYVPANAQIAVTFNEPVTPAPGWFTLACSSTGNHAGAYNTPLGLGIVWMITPDSDFTNNETCVVTILADHISDNDLIDPPDGLAADYSFSFTTIPHDDPPRVVVTTPVNGQMFVLPGSNISVTFSEPVTPADGWFNINCSSSGSHSGSVSNLLSQNITFIIDPAVNFSRGESCTVTVYASVISDNDSIDPPDTMTANHSFSFTTLPYFAAGEEPMLCETESGEMLPCDVEAGEIDPAEPMLCETESGEMLPCDVEAGEIDPEEPMLCETESGEMLPCDAETGETDPAEPMLCETESGEMLPCDAETGETDPEEPMLCETESGEMLPCDAEAGGMPPTDGELHETEPAEIIPGEIDPIITPPGNEMTTPDLPKDY